MADEKNVQQNQQNQVSEEEVFKQRKDKLFRLREEENYDPFKQTQWNVEHNLAYVREKFDFLKENEWAKRF